VVDKKVLAIPNKEEINPIALSIVEFRLAEGIN